MNDLFVLSENLVSFEESFELYKKCSAKASEINVLPPLKAKDTDFYDDFLGSMIQKPEYSNCRFHNSPFLASNGAYSYFEECFFNDCKFKDSDFRYGYFKDCSFIQKEKFDIHGTGFNYSTFLKTKFYNVDINGCSFRYMELDNSEFKQCTMKNSSFEHCNIKNCTFEDIDLRNIGIRYNTFNNVTFKNIIFPILDMTNNFDLLKEFQRQPDNVKFSLGNNGEVTYIEALELLQKLIPYYLETKQFFNVINILWINNDHDNFKLLLPQVLEYTVKHNDFEALQNICSLIVRTNMLDAQQLKNIYSRITEIAQPDKMPTHMYKSYIFYIEHIRQILYVNPENNPVLQITLSTDITKGELHKLIPILEDIDNVVRETSESLNPQIKLVHYSPYEIIIFICGNLDLLLKISQMFYYTIGGVNALNQVFNPHYNKVMKGSAIPYKEEKFKFAINIKDKINITIEKNIKDSTKSVECYVNYN